MKSSFRAPPKKPPLPLPRQASGRFTNIFRHVDKKATGPCLCLLFPPAPCNVAVVPGVFCTDFRPPVHRHPPALAEECWTFGPPAAIVWAAHLP